jgi:hypothetical protein
LGDAKAAPMTLTQNDIDEIKAYYRDEALKIELTQHRRFALDFLKMFDVYFALQNGESMIKKNQSYGQFLNDKNKLNRAEGMIERYFKMKERGAL